MNIVYAADNNFVDVLYASIKSLYNANHDLKINLWIIADNVSDENKNKINDTQYVCNKTPISDYRF